MAQTTTNLGLTKPDYSETADIAVINSNFQTLDDVIGAWDTSSAGMNGTIKDIVSSNVSRIGSLESSVKRVSITTKEGRTSKSISLTGTKMRDKVLFLTGNFTMPANTSAYTPYLSNDNGSFKQYTLGVWLDNDLAKSGVCGVSTTTNVWLLGTTAAQLAGKTIQVKLVSFDLA